MLRAFYDFHREAGTRADGQSVPAGPGRVAAGGRTPTTTRWSRGRAERTGGTGRAVPQRVPRAIPDEKFKELFAALRSHRDRALVAFWVSTGARASELLGRCQGDVDPGQQLITVVRKGSRALQQLPASPDAFVWLRLYQAAAARPGAGRAAMQPLWWTLRRPFRPLTYHAAHRMFERANAALGANWTLHDLRHTAAYRMARDPALPLTDVQWVLGHAHLTTTQIYLTPLRDEVVAARAGPPRPPGPRRERRRRRPPGYRPAVAGRAVREARREDTGQTSARSGLPKPPRPAHADLRRAGSRRVRMRPTWPADLLSARQMQRQDRRAAVPARQRHWLPAPRTTRILDWLAAQPGGSWQQRWMA